MTSRQLPRPPNRSPDSLAAQCSFDCSVDGSFDEPCDVCSFTPEFCYRAGPRAKIYFEPAEVHAAIVNCGGLCPGINDVVRSVVNTLEVGYGVKKISGIRFGWGGFWKDGVENMPLTRRNTSGVQDRGGSIIGCGRGGGDVPKIVDSIEQQGINMVFVIGGNGSHAGANAISAECAERGLKVSVVGIPKTIDNDILHIDKTFGFDTAVEEAQKAIKAAAVEAKSALNGVGVVKLMGRQSGFIAMHAALASGSVDVCLIPEVPFAMEGPNGVVEHIKSLLPRRATRSSVSRRVRARSTSRRRERTRGATPSSATSGRGSASGSSGRCRATSSTSILPTWSGASPPTRTTPSTAPS